MKITRNLVVLLLTVAVAPAISQNVHSEVIVLSTSATAPLPDGTNTGIIHTYIPGGWPTDVGHIGGPISSFIGSGPMQSLWGGFVTVTTASEYQDFPIIGGFTYYPGGITYPASTDYWTSWDFTIAIDSYGDDNNPNGLFHETISGHYPTEAAAAPEPATLALLGSGVLPLMGIRRKKQS